MMRVVGMIGCLNERTYRDRFSDHPPGFFSFYSRAPYLASVKVTRHAGGLRPTLTDMTGRAHAMACRRRGELSLMSRQGE